jgi:hypothetical protein
MPKPVATIFLPLTAEWFGRNQAQRPTVLVRTTPGRDALQSVESELTSRHPDLLIFDVQTVQEKLERLNSFIDWSSSIYVVLGLLALLLACIGLAGVTAYAVVRRTKEIGVRTALGATTGQVRRMILSEGAVPVIAGSAPGYIEAFTQAFFPHPWRRSPRLSPWARTSLPFWWAPRCCSPRSQCWRAMFQRHARRVSIR